MPANDSSSRHLPPFEFEMCVDEDEAKASHLTYYVYTLAYPDGRVFYVGKGVADRINDHEREARAGGMSQKCHIVRDIWEQGGQVVKRKVAFFLTDEEALRYEHYLLTSLDGLANELGGSKNIVETMLSRDDMHVFGISIRRFTEDGQEYRSAREMAGFLGYSSWVAFRKVIARVERILLENNLYVPEDFRHTTLTVLARHDSLRQIEDIHLSRTGFLHVLQGADSTKTMVDIGKSYIARRMLEREDLDEYRRLFGNRDMQSSTVLTHQSQQRLRRPQGASESASHT